MKKVFIYHEFDIIQELQELKNNPSGTWEEESRRYRIGVQKILDVLEKSLEVMIKDEDEE